VHEKIQTEAGNESDRVCEFQKKIEGARLAAGFCFQWRRSRILQEQQVNRHEIRVWGFLQCQEIPREKMAPTPI